MTVQEIIEECRGEARDTAIVDADRLWPNADMIRYYNRIHRDIARRTLCIKDQTTVEDASSNPVCVIPLTVVDYTTYTAGSLDAIWAADSTSPLYQLDVTPYLVDLHSSILEIEDAYLVTAKQPLHKASAADWMRLLGWQQVVSLPTEYATDLQTKKLALNYRHTENDTIHLAVKRLPLVEATVANMDTLEPEFRVNYHDLMKNGILNLMYKKQDADTFDPKKAIEYSEMYEDDVDEIKRQERIVLDDSLKSNGLMIANT